MSRLHDHSVSSERDGSDHQLILIAHRGKGPTSKLSGHPNRDVPSHLPPENTLKAFRAAIAEGADGIELDVFISKDGVAMVVHDDELNINVAGADRKRRNLGLVSQHSAADLKAFNMGHGEKMPTLEEVTKLIAQANKERNRQGKPNLIINIELKGVNSAEPTLDVVHKAITNRLVNPEDIIFCSFEHQSLEKLKELDQSTQVAPGIKTAFLFGKDNVDVAAGWIVPAGIHYRPEAIQELESLATRLNPSMVAYDAVLWDIYQPLITSAKDMNLDIHASTSDFRDFRDTDFLDFLLQAQKDVNVYFKTDAPGEIRALLAREQQQEVGLGPSKQILKISTREDIPAPSSVIPAQVEDHLDRLTKPQSALPPASSRVPRASPSRNTSQIVLGDPTVPTDYTTTHKASFPATKPGQQTVLPAGTKPQGLARR